MTFAEFQEQRKQLLATRPDLADCGETNLYASLADFIPSPTPEPTETVHRCHLATEWGERFGFPPDVAKRAFISCGVRDSLARLFAHYAGRSATVWLPSDNYPVYWELARAAGLQPQGFPTLPKPQWPTRPASSGDEIILVTNPLKPLGRSLESADLIAMGAWLTESPRRRLWLDAVYTFGTRFDEATLALVKKGQTVLLHSLTKGWLHPRLFGVALVPEVDFSDLIPTFRRRPPPQDHLARARVLLGEHGQLPTTIGEQLYDGNFRLRTQLAPVLSHFEVVDEFPPSRWSQSYLFPVCASWDELLKANILGLPASTFGSTRTDLTILSSLSFLKGARA